MRRAIVMTRPTGLWHARPMDERSPKRVEDFTRPFLVVAFFLLFFSLVVVWEIWGYNRALALGGALWLALRVTSP